MALDRKSMKLFLPTSEMESVPASNTPKARTRPKPGNESKQLSHASESLFSRQSG
jgi:hypothetical protein